MSASGGGSAQHAEKAVLLSRGVLAVVAVCFAVLGVLSSSSAVRRRLCRCCRACSRLALGCVMRLWMCACTSPRSLLAAVILGGLVVWAAACVNKWLVRHFSVLGAMVVNMLTAWTILRLAVRVLVFPGSIVFWRRSTEASYRVEMSKQFGQHVQRLQQFCRAACSAGPASCAASSEDVLLSCLVLQQLARNFRAQQQDQVRLTLEQAQLKLLVLAVEAWLKSARVLERDTKQPALLTDWLRTTANKVVPATLISALANAHLEEETLAAAGGCTERLEQLALIFEDLQRNGRTCCGSLGRLLREPPVGSLHQLRAELLLKYSAHHYWVRTPSGRRIDAMFVSCAKGKDAASSSKGPPANSSRGDQGSPEPAASQEEGVPLKRYSGAGSRAELPGYMGPVVVWCNPNAGYYETMSYEGNWLEFYLSQGCSIFLFNYSGFGRSEGSPSPEALVADGNAVIEFLKRRGFQQIGIHGRSIGGVAACRLARMHGSLIKLLVADRTFSTLSQAARSTFGGWAAHCLRLAATGADNLMGYRGASCYKVMLCDPRDLVIPDLAALRTAAAVAALRDLPPQAAKLEVGLEQRTRVCEAWAFLNALVRICTEPEASSDPVKRMPKVATPAACKKRESFEDPKVVGKPADTRELHVHVDISAPAEAADEDKQGFVTGRPRRRPWLAVAHDDDAAGAVDIQWLEERPEWVCAAMGAHAGDLHAALEAVGKRLNAAGTQLGSALGARPPSRAREGLESFLANMQVWGSLGSLKESCTAVDKEIELVLAKGYEMRPSSGAAAATGSDAASQVVGRLSRLAGFLAPDYLAGYHRHLSRALAAAVLKEFQGRVAGLAAALRADLGPPAASSSEGGGAPPATAVLADAVVGRLGEIEGLLSAIDDFFRTADEASRAGGSGAVSHGGGSPAGEEERELRKAPDGLYYCRAEFLRLFQDPKSWEESGGECRPAMRLGLSPHVDRGVTGYLVALECGHNGVLSKGELQHLAVHLRHSGFAAPPAAGVAC